MSKESRKSLELPKLLLWEYDLTSFYYDKSWFIVIERIIEKGVLEKHRFKRTSLAKNTLKGFVDEIKVDFITHAYPLAPLKLTLHLRPRPTNLP